MTDTDLHKAIGDGEEVVFADRCPFLPTSIIFSEARSYLAFGERRKLDIVHCNARQLSWLLASTWRHTLLPFFRCPLLYSCQTLPFFRRLLYSCQTLPFFRRLLCSCQTLPFFRQLLYSCQTTPPGQMGQF